MTESVSQVPVNGSSWPALGAMPLKHLAQCPGYALDAIVVVQLFIAVSNVTNMEDDTSHLLWAHTAIPLLNELKQVL